MTIYKCFFFPFFPVRQHELSTKGKKEKKGKIQEIKESKQRKGSFNDNI